MTAFDLWPIPWGEGHGVQGQICDILRPQLAMNASCPSGHTDSHTLDTYIWGGGGGGGALILYRCRAFDLLASVDAHLCRQVTPLEAENSVPDRLWYCPPSAAKPVIESKYKLRPGRADLHLLVGSWSLQEIAYICVWLENSFDPPEGHPGQLANNFLIRILSTSFISVSIFSVCTRVSISMDFPEGHPGQCCVHLYARILSTSSTSVSIFSVWCYSSYSISMGHTLWYSLYMNGTEQQWLWALTK